jgi:hypothetical protein
MALGDAERCVMSYRRPETIMKPKLEANKSGRPTDVASSAVLGCCSNTDKEIWRKKPGDYYAPSIHVTEGGGIGMNVGGHVIVAPIERWHEAAELLMCVNPCLPEWRRKLAMWLLNARVKGYKQPNIPSSATPQAGLEPRSGTESAKAVGSGDWLGRAINDI